MPEPVTLAEIQELVKALEKGGYNAAPTKLRSGCISFDPDVYDTEEKVDQLYKETFDDRHACLISVADVEHAIVDEIEMGTDYQNFDWAPINRAFDRLRKLATSRATPPPSPDAV